MCKHARPHTHKAKIIMMLIMPFIFKCTHIILELSSCTRLNEQSQSKKKDLPLSVSFFLKHMHKHTHTHTSCSHARTARKYCLQALWDDICGNSFRIHFNTLCRPKCQSSFLVSFHDFMSHIKWCSLLHNGLFKLHYRRISPSKEN